MNNKEVDSNTDFVIVEKIKNDEDGRVVKTFEVDYDGQHYLFQGTEKDTKKDFEEYFEKVKWGPKCGCCNRIIFPGEPVATGGDNELLHMSPICGADPACYVGHMGEDGEIVPFNFNLNSERVSFLPRIRRVISKIFGKK